MPTPTMDVDLPFLVSHAAWMRWVVLALGTALAVLLVVMLLRLVRRWLARRRARTAAAMWALFGETMVRGVLRGGDTDPVLTTLEASTAGRLVRSSWAADPWIETPDGRVDLEGDVVVLAGDRVYAARGGIPRETPEVVEAHAREALPQLHRPRLRDRKVRVSHLTMLTPGTPVVASGELVTTDGARRLTNGVRIAAVTPRAAVTPLPIVVTLAIVAALGALTYRMMDRGGARLTQACRDATSDPEAFVEVGETHVCALAAAVSGDEDRAVEAMTGMLLDHPYRDRRTFERLSGLIARTEGCAALLEFLFVHQHVEETLVHARACGDRRYEHVALVAQGRFADAIAVPVEATPELNALPLATTVILAGGATAGAPSPDLGELRRVRVEEMLSRVALFVDDAYAAWLAPAAMAAAPARSAAHAHALRLQTLAHVLDGDHAAAAATAQEAASIAIAVLGGPDNDAYRYYDLPDAVLLPGVVALRTASTDFAFPLEEVPGVEDVEDREFLIDRRRDVFGFVLDRLGRQSESPWDFYSGYEAARGGDGRELARALAAGNRIDDVALLAVLPRVVQGRDALIRNLAWGHRGWMYFNSFTSDELVFRLALRRDLLRVAGLDDEAARWHSYYERYDAALSDPRIAATLYERSR